MELQTKTLWLSYLVEKNFKSLSWIAFLWCDVYPWVSYPSSLLCPFIFWSSILIAGVVTFWKIYFSWTERSSLKLWPGWKVQRKKQTVLFMTYFPKTSFKMWRFDRFDISLHCFYTTYVTFQTNLMAWCCQFSIIWEGKVQTGWP